MENRKKLTPTTESSVPPVPRSLPLSTTFGFLSGLLGGCVSEPGPPLVLYSSLRGWSPSESRLMLARFILPCQLLTVASVCPLEEDTVAQLLATAPFVLLANVIGRGIAEKVDKDKFDNVLLVVIAGLGGLCLVPK